MAQHRLHLIKDIFLGALPLRGEERDLYLAEHCPDLAVRAEVQRLLDANEPTQPLNRDVPLAQPPAAPGPGLPIGSRLGHYEIRKKLGAGGMGWVYEAFDPRLRRIVAIKILPPRHISEDHRRRFAREAQSASALNHPNIITVYEVGSQDDIDFIVMERVEGETLGRRIGRKGLDLRTALTYGIQIADALAAAHDAGLVHRDLKPGNIMVTERGLVKILDFGLAKQTARGASPDGITMEAPLSEVGQVLGTFSYMSPEQAQGRPVDTRSDIFSYGSVFFEMLTGRRAFADSGIGTLAAIVQNDPPLTNLPPALPRALIRVVSKCLAKKPTERWQHMCDVKMQLEDVLKELDSPLPEERPRRVSWFRAGWPVVLTCLLAGAVLAAAILYFAVPRYPEPQPELVLRMLTADSGLNTSPALSRDGKFLAFASDRSNEGNLDIWLQQIGGRDPMRLTRDPSDDTDPDFSPDGTRIAYRSERNGGGVYVVPAFGGDSPVLVAPGGRNPRFSPDGKWIAYWTGREGAFYPGSSHIFVVEAGGGQPHPVHPELGVALFPVWSPRSNELLVLGLHEKTRDWFIVPVDNASSIRKTGALAQITAQGLAEQQITLNVRPAPLEWTEQGGDEILFASAMGDVANLWEIALGKDGQIRGPARRVTRGPGRHVRASRVVKADSESIVFSDEEVNYDVWAMAIDADSGKPRRDPVRLTSAQSIEWAPSISSDGRQLAYIGRRGGTWLLRTKNLATGNENTLISSSARMGNSRIAGDGSSLIYSTLEYHIYSVPLAGGAVKKLCDACGTVMGVSQDGTKVTYEPRTNEDLLYLDAAAGTNGKLAVRDHEGVILSAGQLSRDDKWAVFHSISNPGGIGQIWIVPVKGDRPAERSEWIPVTDGKTQDRHPCWAPGGRLVYFMSERDGFRCIWARPLDAVTKRPSGDAFAVRHFHSARQSLRSSYITGLSVGGDQMVFAFGELTGNVWLAESQRVK